MSVPEHQPVYLADYRKPPFLISKVELVFELGDACTLVRSRLHVSRNPAAAGPDIPDLQLNGREIIPVDLAINGTLLGEDEYLVADEKLTIYSPPAEFVLEQQNRVYPEKNTALEGLYRSGTKLCTQCEAEGFRRITWYLDRPDVLATFTVTLIGDPARYPVVLANGNLVEKGEMPDGRHFAVWHDPYPKPSYLFALVAGDLVLIEDHFTTMSGRKVALQFYVEAHNRERCGHALASLQKAFAWDEKTFGLEYDLDQYMVVAADDFNMGAMENKGLNVFNSKYVLASPELATDADYEAIEAVIAHEYFHNWTGNRVTCRDWFQLSLKEGLTVFRDQEFSADMTSRPVKRITDVQMLRSRQFPEDNGPMAHAVRTGSYIEINNFYTLTVYEKGAELVRMVHTLVGAENFRKGLNLYLARHDGSAATVEDFVAAMAEAGGRELGHFMRWYDQGGTPRLDISGEYDPEGQTFTLNVHQSCPPTPGQPHKDPLHIPLRVGLLDRQGREMELHLAGAPTSGGTSLLLEIHDRQENFVFTGISGRPVPSLLRDFSAPVIMNYDYADGDLALLFAADPDPFAKWEAGQQLAVRQLLAMIDTLQAGREPTIPAHVLDSFGAILAACNELDPPFLALLLALPSEEYLAERMEVVDVEAIHQARKIFRVSIARRFRSEFLAMYKKFRCTEPYRYDPVLAGERQLKNTCLAYLCALGEEFEELCSSQYYQSDNMTDRLVALRLAVHGEFAAGGELVRDFEQRWGKEPLVMDKWLAIQATAPQPGTLQKVRGLMEHPAFSMKNPNRVRALLGAFAMSNPLSFNAADGAGYAFMAEQIMALDTLNPQIAARMAGSFSRMRRFDRLRQELMQNQLKKIRACADISKDLCEVVAKILDN
ncbi:MAG: aminopeptidase N [Proteobacteria bacterium]|nr:aminopeptidase N [Pseudomonadota bacterium]